ncbi:unnamed protein product [[Candida] boidinii]|uniref:DNA-directed RNA polymerase subunit n=1 Tax=Candida boidinii TaxID=5477 RepID=A0A9W6SXS4_CANBO|nr:hypothetical protein BVG19_g5093 [[Candida] boidinii]OWB52225.1 hypothetical protein B5S27_g3797 [[Candida] boidinii]OWB69712.1 hypothetical protein B5S30_g5139 [[Candida] boidinii]OWB86393.1 hypothetical protein B5S33_g5084 [[Candida] boidinii]GME67074.1 unnamed protein product [[Candida] boidinii]
MFQLSVISDLIRIPPHLFHLPINISVKEELSRKYSNKVIHKLGLVISVWDIMEIDDGLLKPGDGATFVNVKFRCVVFKPFVGEVLTGWIEKITETGIKVNLEFFNDIFIPKKFIFDSSEYSKDENAWVWSVDEDTKLYMDINEKINFRVEEEIFTNIKPKGPDNSLSATTSEENEDENKEKVPPYAIIASCQTDGMGCVSWWE